MRALFALLVLAVVSGAHAQFVMPKREYHQAEPGLYVEDPFIVKYRKEYFAVFAGDFKRFREAHAEIKAMVDKNPKDARAMVWLGNGQMIEAGLAFSTGKKEVGKTLWAEASKTLDRAVALSPDDPNIYMMRAASLVIVGERFPKEVADRSVWTRLRDDCLKFIAFVGPDRMPRTSIHLRGEAYGCLGLAYKALGEKQKAKRAFETVVRMNPGTAYETRAKRELEALR